MKKKFGVLIVNLGSPRSPTIPAIRDFLKEFLSDPYVIDLPRAYRWLLVHLIIAPFRPSKIVHRYKAIWTKLGSPLTVHTIQFKQKLEERLKLLSNYDFMIDIGMRYGAPSMGQALKAMADQDIKDVLIFQMYPQEALSSTTTARDRLKALAQDLSLNPIFLPAYFGDPGFIDSLAETYREKTNGISVDHTLFSFHGIPIHQTTKQSQDPKCGTPGCCDSFSVKNCYKSQCEETSRLLAKALGLDKSQYTVCYQSRLSEKWIQPFTDHVIRDLPNKGIKNIAVISPSFVTDCLETIEELAIQERDRFVSAGGHMYTYVPCLNDRNSWVNAAFGMISKRLSQEIGANPN